MPMGHRTKLRIDGAPELVTVHLMDFQARWHDPAVHTRDFYLTALARDAATFAELLETADLSLPVPSCPGWSIADLTRHLGGIHRWAHDVVLTGSPGDEPEGPTDDDALIAWFGQGAAELLAILRSTNPSTPTWTFGPKPRLVEFWNRRQAQETHVHLWDLQDALGIPCVRDDVLALDGVHEVVTMFFPRQVRLDRMPQLTHVVMLDVSDFPDHTFVVADDGTNSGALPDVRLKGSAVEILRVLWGRDDVGQLEIDGDIDIARAIVSSGLTP